MKTMTNFVSSPLLIVSISSHLKDLFLIDKNQTASDLMGTKLYGKPQASNSNVMKEKCSDESYKLNEP